MRVTLWHWLGYAMAVLVAGGALGAVVALGLREHAGPACCPPGTKVQGARCCAEGQIEAAGRCAGAPRRCPFGFQLEAQPEPGCVVIARRVRVAGGKLVLGPNDWHARAVESRAIEVRPFLIDADEVTVHRWRACAQARVCRALPSSEPGLPVTGVMPAEAEGFCHYAGGRLSSGEQWLMAAAGTDGRRYPWGSTGLVCRRAAFGLVRGPCATGASLPDWAGLRPDGATPEKVMDLAGNVAEWTSIGDGLFLARGGSFRSELAADLQSWATETSSVGSAHIGFRCVYDEARITP